jgi:hypothetical protein
MKPLSALIPVLSLLLLACAPAAPGRLGGGDVAAAPPHAGSQDTTVASAPPPATPRPASPPRGADSDDPLCAPLILDADPGFGTHVVMRRLPTQGDLEELSFISGLRQVLVALPEWPATYAALRPIQQVILPQGTELVVLVPGWPPTREALGAWDLLDANVRLIVVVSGPPADRALITEMNRIRTLDRIIAQMEHPSRSGFERLQRPLSFRVLRR